MKCTLCIESERNNPEVVIYASEKTRRIEEIISYVERADGELFAFDNDGNAIRLELSEVNAFAIENGRLYAFLDSGKYRLKNRLYEIEALELCDFVKINQSSLANIRKIKRFGVSLGGALTVEFCCGFKDYVSRRQLKTVKERLGVKRLE